METALPTTTVCPRPGQKSGCPGKPGLCSNVPVLGSRASGGAPRPLGRRGWGVGVGRGRAHLKDQAPWQPLRLLGVHLASCPLH